MSGGWGTPRRGDIDEGPPSDDPERPPKGLGSGALANPKRAQVCCANCKCHEEEKPR